MTLGPWIKFSDSPRCGCCSVTKLSLTLCDPMNYGTPGSATLYHLPEFAQTHVHWVSDAIPHRIPHCPLLLLSSVFPSIRAFSTESALHTRWPNYWSFSFNISPSNEYSGLITHACVCKHRYMRVQAVHTCTHEHESALQHTHVRAHAQTQLDVHTHTHT